MGQKLEKQDSEMKQQPEEQKDAIEPEKSLNVEEACFGGGGNFGEAPNVLFLN